jgi:chromosome segregation ATPase
MAVAEHGSMEGGFGSGLRAKLQGGDAAEPRSPGEAIAAAPAVDETEAEALRAELNASLAREQGLRASLSDQIDTSGRELEMVQELAEQSAALDRRAAALAETEANLDERERMMAQRLMELDGLLEAKEEITKAEARIAEREQLIDLKVRELKTGDEDRAAAAAELKDSLEEIKKREKDLARAEAEISSRAEDSEARREKLMQGLAEREEKAKARDEEARKLEKAVAEREAKLSATER